jgi:hypothetical protein
MLLHGILLFLSVILLSQTAAAYTLAQDALPANPNSRLSARHALLLLRQNVVYCAREYLISVCCYLLLLTPGPRDLLLHLLHRLRLLRTLQLHARYC